MEGKKESWEAEAKDRMKDCFIFSVEFYLPIKVPMRTRTS